MKKPIITFDIEDWQQSTWDRSLPVSEIAKRNTFNLLDICDNLNIKSTMFIQGKFAETFPEVVKEINKRGHEISCHGYSHIEIFKQTKAEFRNDIDRSKNIIENLTGERIIGYRAPDFSVIKDTLWALEILCEFGFQYDSSIYPIKHNRYGIDKFPHYPVKINISTNYSIVEYPIAVFSFYNIKIPIGGGGYHRLLPSFIINFLSKKILMKNDFIFYCHPYEFNRYEFKELELDIPLKIRLHQGIGRRYFKNRFISFIKNFGASRIKDNLNSKDFKEYNFSEI